MGQLCASCGKIESLADPNVHRNNNIVKSILVGPAKERPYVSIDYPLYNVDLTPCYEASKYTLRVQFKSDVGLYAALKSDTKEEDGQEKLWYFTYEDEVDPNCYVLKNLDTGLELKFAEGWLFENPPMPNDVDPYINLVSITATQQQIGKPKVSVQFYIKVASIRFDH